MRLLSQFVVVCTLFQSIAWALPAPTSTLVAPRTRASRPISTNLPQVDNKVTEQMLAARLGIHDTKVFHHNATSGAFTTDRKELHEKIIKEFMDAGVNAIPKNKLPPLLVFTGGSPGAGKSHVMAQLSAGKAYDLSQFMVIDPDLVRNKLPEYQLWKKEHGGKDLPFAMASASAAGHKEAGIITNELFERAIQAGRNIFRDTTLRNDDLFKQYAKMLTAKGYKVVIIHINVKEKTSLDRIQQRAKETKRDVPMAFFNIAKPSIVQGVMNELRSKVDAYIRIENDDKQYVSDCWVKESKSSPGKKNRKAIGKGTDGAKWTSFFTKCAGNVLTVTKKSSFNMA